VAARRSGAKCIVSRRVDFPIGKGLFSGLKYRYGVDRYIAISRAVKDVMTRGGVAAERIAVVHSGIDPARFDGIVPADHREEFGIARDELVVGNVAALVDHKGQRYLIDAVPYVLAELPRTRFVIVGEGELRDELVAQAKPYGDRVIFTGFRTDVGSLMLFFDLFVMSSHMEGLCTSLLDAMSLGCPVVATRAGGIPEIVESGVDGVLVEPRNPKALADAIVALLRQPEERARLARAGKDKVAREFTADAMVEGTVKVYLEVLGIAN